MGRYPFLNRTWLQRSARRVPSAFVMPGTGLAAVLVALLAWTSESTATTWLVRQHVPTIRAGIDSARAGDDILIPPGTYHEHDLMKKVISVSDCATTDTTGSTIGLIRVLAYET